MLLLQWIQTNPPPLFPQFCICMTGPWYSMRLTLYPIWRTSSEYGIKILNSLYYSLSTLYVFLNVFQFFNVSPNKHCNGAQQMSIFNCRLIVYFSDSEYSMYDCKLNLILFACAFKSVSFSHSNLLFRTHLIRNSTWLPGNFVLIGWNLKNLLFRNHMEDLIRIF